MSSSYAAISSLGEHCGRSNDLKLRFRTRWPGSLSVGPIAYLLDLRELRLPWRMQETKAAKGTRSSEVDSFD